MALAGREKSMGFVWFLVATLLVATVAWIAYDETISRRTWKKYAAEWQESETARLKKAIQDEEKKIDQNELKRIKTEREKAERVLESAEFKKAQEKLAQDKIKNQDAKSKLQFTKADLDEVFYLWKHALHKGHAEGSKELDNSNPEVDQYQKRYNALDEQVKKLTAIADDAEKQYNASRDAVDNFQKKLADLKAQEAKIYEKVTPLQKQLKAAEDRGEPIEQIVVNDVGREGAVKWGAVDRCTSCHIPITTPGYEKGKQPFQTHPNLKIFDIHPVEDFGCVSCHGGQGRATQIEGHPMGMGDYAHGFEKHWDNPLLKGNYIQSSCNKCHLNQFSLDMAPVYSEGKRIFVDYGCVSCHKLKGLEWAPRTAPDLTKIKEKVYVEWFYQWITKPTDYLPKTRMPQPPWHSEEDKLKAMSYILAKSEPFNFKYGDFTGGDAALGEQTFNKIGCMACHSMQDKGGNAAPALDKIAEKTTGKWIYNWIREPKNWSTHARMPSLRLNDDEAKNLTAFLVSKGKKPEEDLKLRAALADPKNIEDGFRVINTYGCYACHNIKGFENSAPPSVELSAFGKKDVHELAFGDAKIDQTWEAWTNGKLTNPQMYVDERSSSFMPKPNITEEQRKALLVFLKGQRPEELPAERVPFDPQVEKGRQLVWRYNCTACHVIEGQGGDINQIVTDENYQPPNLASTGARLQTDWMKTFLKNPASHEKVRFWFNLRMPTFGFTDDEVDGLVKYFKRLSKVDTILEEIPSSNISPENLEAGQTLIKNLQCTNCHVSGDTLPSGDRVLAPSLAYGDHRLRPQWINPWVRNPSDLVPNTRMPGYYSALGESYKEILNGDADKQVQAIVDYILYSGNHGSVISNAVSDAPAVETMPTASGVQDEKTSDSANAPK